MSETVGYVGKLTLHKNIKTLMNFKLICKIFGKAYLEKKRNKFYQDVEEIDDYDLEYLDKEAYEYLIYNYHYEGYEGNGAAVQK